MNLNSVLLYEIFRVDLNSNTRVLESPNVNASCFLLNELRIAKDGNHNGRGKEKCG